MVICIVLPGVGELWNLPKSPLLMKSNFHLRTSHPSIYFHVDRPLKTEIGRAPPGTEARIANGARGLTTEDLKVVKTQRPYLWHDPLVIHVPPYIPVGDK